MKVRKAVIAAGGMGTRFLPATKAQPKEMLPLIDVPVIQHVVEEAVQAGIRDILIVTGRSKQAIEEHFTRSVELEKYLLKQGKQELFQLVRRIGHLAEIQFAHQDEPLGLGHAVYQARHYVGNEPFALLLGDMLFGGATPQIGQLLSQYEVVDNPVIGVTEVPLHEVSRYGVISSSHVVNGLHLVQDMIEKPGVHVAPSRMAMNGRYILVPALFESLASLGPGIHGEIQLTDGLRRLNQSVPIYAMVTEDRTFDVGNKLGYLKAIVELALARPDLGEEFQSYLMELLDTSHRENHRMKNHPYEITERAIPVK